MIKIGEKSIVNGGGELSIELQKEQHAKENENKGRTMWDFLSERFADRKMKPAFDWYKFFLFMLVLAIFGYGAYLYVSEFSKINSNFQKITYEIGSIHEDTLNASRAVDSLTKAPTSSGWFGRHQLDVTACKARGVEALQRSGGQNINAEQSSTAYASFSGNDGLSYMSVIHCPEDGIVYLYVVGRDIKVVGSYKEKVKKEFENIVAHVVPPKLK